jgi:hypothetical protein
MSSNTGGKVRAVGVIGVACLALGLPPCAAAEQQAAGHSRAGVGRTSQSHIAHVQSEAAGAPPTVATNGVEVTSPTTATVIGGADPDGEKTTLRAEYASASAPWCTSQGTKGTPLKSNSRQLPPTKAILSEIGVRLEGLTPGAKYCAELVAKNKSGTARGGPFRFSTPIDTASKGAPVSKSASSQPPAPNSGNWPTSAVVAVALLGASLLAGMVALLAPKFRSRRQGSTRPAAG